ncbi:gamma-glutamyl-gamma-aminobutyrate hydrolase family protein [Agrilactobacillus fermenti]|uniref:gamma-glutamyl-gamma-aminobutyrate hydrolase family protein n=1 Tax=Agrilactobacillus fermenti TaxID=2586909 RepID=UPI001E5F129D|nr:gamma-glutamyl-gamma-aminobutyrate hydrolase family protein [Agrilactobacillus fermenti]MCD2255529.1 gamma-glutamyl-gamma-aminobutyrate hydrolase family protein [Agrilactobacillus fermenti]
MKPRIAIVVSQYEYSETVFHHHSASFVPQFYLNAIAAVGGLPVLLPLTNLADVRDYVSLFDGFLLVGGQDVSPNLYGEEPLPKISQTDLNRDKFEMSLVQMVRHTNKPLLGVCRGLQVLNVAFGGTLYQDLSYRKHVTYKHVQEPTDDRLPTHYVYQTKASFLSQIFGEKVFVNSLHHQAIKALGDDLVTLSRSSDDLIEGIQSRNHQFFAVQWHPEMLIDYDRRNLAIFGRLIERANQLK